MKYLLLPVVALVLLTSCKKEEETPSLTFRSETYTQKTSLPCPKDCPEAVATLPIAEGESVAADSINRKVFSVMKEIIVFGEKPYAAKDVPSLLTQYIASYEKLQKETPDERIGWEAKVEGSVIYHTDSILNIELKHYTYTGGAHGYSGKRSLIFDATTGKSIPESRLFRDEAAFKTFAEGKFREAYGIKDSDSINQKGRFMFENGRFILPQTYFYTDKGFLLYYNVYEIASYAEGPQEVLIPYDQMQPYLRFK